MYSSTRTTYQGKEAIELLKQKITLEKNYLKQDKRVIGSNNLCGFESEGAFFFFFYFAKEGQLLVSSLGFDTGSKEHILNI